MGETAGDKAVREAVAGIKAMEEGGLVPKTKYDKAAKMPLECLRTLR